MPFHGVVESKSFAAHGTLLERSQSMNTSGHLSLRFTLAAGAITALAALPQSASAQLVGSFMRSGAVTQSAQNQSPSGQQPIQMRPGPIVRGASPVYRGGPTTSAEPVYSSGPIYGRGPIFNPQPSFNQQPVYTNPQPGFGRGGNYYYNYGNGYSSGPVVTLPAEPYYPSYGGGTSYGQQPYLPPVGPANGFFRNPIPPVGPWKRVLQRSGSGDRWRPSPAGRLLLRELLQCRHARRHISLGVLGL